MAFCKNCGKQIPDGASSCPYCATPVNSTSYNNYSGGTNDYVNSFDPQDVNSNKGMAILAYLSWLVLVPLLAAPQSRFARFHANQGLVLAIASTIWSIASGIIANIPLIGWIISVIMGIGSIFFFVLMIIGIVNAANGEAKELPLIGKIKILN